MSYARTTTFNSRRQSNWQRNQNTVAFASAVKLGPIAHTVMIALMITVLGLIYLSQVTRTVSYDYTASKIDNKIAELTDQKADLEVENARLTALETIQKSSVASTMKTPTESTYISE